MGARDREAFDGQAVRGGDAVDDRLRSSKRIRRERRRASWRGPGRDQIVGRVEIAEAHAVQADARHASDVLHDCTDPVVIRSAGSTRAQRIPATTPPAAADPSSSSTLAPCPPALASVGSRQSLTTTRSTGAVSSHGVVQAAASASSPPIGPRSGTRSSTHGIPTLRSAPRRGWR
jgi:hypothetical protein